MVEYKFNVRKEFEEVYGLFLKIRQAVNPACSPRKLEKMSWEEAVADTRVTLEVLLHRQDITTNNLLYHAQELQKKLTKNSHLYKKGKLIENYTIEDINEALVLLGQKRLKEYRESRD